MSSVIRLRSQRLSEIPILVLVDLQQEYVAAPRITALPGAHAALRKCRDALTAARANGIPVAFTRLQGASAFFNRSSKLFDWVEGFEPLRSEMVFDRELPSCYASEGFAAFMKDVRAPVVIAGFSGEFRMSCDAGRRLSSPPANDLSRRRLGEPTAQWPRPG